MSQFLGFPEARVTAILLIIQRLIEGQKLSLERDREKRKRQLEDVSSTGIAFDQLKRPRREEPRLEEFVAQGKQQIETQQIKKALRFASKEDRPNEEIAFPTVAAELASSEFPVPGLQRQSSGTMKAVRLPTDAACIHQAIEMTYAQIR